MKKLLLLATTGTILWSVPIFGQRSEDLQLQRRRDRADQERRIYREQERVRNQAAIEMKATMEKMRVQAIFKRRSDGKPLTEKDMERFRAELAPHFADANKYKDFLAQPKTGLFRLLPNLGCSQKYVVSADCGDAAFFGEAYSFRRKDYADPDFLDITLKDGNFVSKGFLSQGIIVALGDVPLESLTPNSPGVKFLFDFAPATESEAVKRQFTEIAAGIKADGYQYAKSERALPNATYALRVIAYRPENKANGLFKRYETAEDYKFFRAKHDERDDLTLVFRVVRQGTDGSLSILWKELSRKDAPKIAFGEKPLTDIGN